MGQVASRGAYAPENDRPSRWRHWLVPEGSGREQSSPPARRSLLSHSRPRPQSALSFRNHESAHLSEDVHSTAQDDVQEPAYQRRSRLRRTRQTLSVQFPHIFGRHSSANLHTSPSPAMATGPYPSSRNAAESAAGGEASLHHAAPHLNLPDLDVSFDDISSAGLPAHPASSSSTPHHTRRQSLRPISLSDRLSSLRPDRGLRNMTTSLRRRSPARRGEDQAAMLSRLLSVAAAATAASLMGGDHRAVSEARSVTGNGDEGTFDNFLEALQNGRIASALRQSGSEIDEGPGGPAAPLNFFRMFRFGSANTRTRSEGHNRHSHGGLWSGHGSSNRVTDSERSGSNNSGEDDATDGRMVPIIIVGIRSISPNSQGNQEEANIPPFLDALSSFPSTVSQPGEATVEGALRQPRNGTTFSHRRRASMGGLSTFPSPYERQRHQRSPEGSRPWSMAADSPAGPRPPPTTPASPGLSTLSSGTSTPAIAVSPSGPESQSTAPSRRASLVRRPTGSTLESTSEMPPLRQRLPRQRRMSDSEYTRFGSGASRRNGVVEPDNSAGEASRSWIIYVLGGSYPENHPILTTPSLFSDSPTYEDMLLLSSLLGPAKPPVASEGDVEQSGGLLTIRIDDSGRKTAVSADGEEVLLLDVDGRCLVCLCDFESDEEARQLKNCAHVFHRECIDQWLLTGRNSCPLCRGQGVEEKSQDHTDSSEESTVIG